MAKPKIILVGTGMAGVWCVEEILKIAPNKFEITFFGSEPNSNNQNQNPSINGLTIADLTSYKKNNIHLYTSETITEIDTEKEMVISDKNRKVHYDRLIIATGAVPTVLPILGPMAYRSVGIKPNIQLAIESGIPVNHGIIVNDFMETGIPNIYSVGECVEHRNNNYRLIAQLHEQGKVLAKRICGMVSNPFQGHISYTKLTVSCVDVISEG